MIFVYTILSFIATIICLTCSLLSIISNSKSKLNIGFSIISFFVGLWSFFNFIMFILDGTELALNIGRLIYVFIIFLPPALYFFIYATINISDKKTKLVISILSAISFIFLLFIPSDMFIKDIKFNTYYPCITPGYVYLAFIIYAVLTYIYSMILLIKEYLKTPSGKRKEHLKFLIPAFCSAFVALVIHFAVVYNNNIEIIPNNIFTILCAIIICYSIYKHGYLNIQRVEFLKITILVITYLIGLGIPLHIIFLYKDWYLAFIILFVIFVIINLIATYMQIQVEQILDAKQTTYQQLLSKTSKGIVNQFELHEVCHIVTGLIKEMIKINFISVFIYDTDKMKFNCLDSTEDEMINSLKLDVNNDVVRFIMPNIKSFVLDEKAKQIFEYISDEITVVIPINLKEKLIGFIFIGKKQDNTIYSKKDLEIFDTIANQTAVSIQNIWFVKKNFQQRETLVKAEKLASIGGMTDGLAHQIKNRLNNFSLIGTSMKLELDLLKQTFDKFSSKEEFSRFVDSNCAKFVQAIGDNVEQTLQLLQNILGFAKSKENSFQFETFSLKQLIQQVEQLVKLKHQKYRFLLSLNIPNADSIYAIKLQIQEVLFNLIDNAIEATVAKKEYLKNDAIKLKNYIPEIKISFQNFSDKCQIVIEDNGIGIKQKDKIKLFSAFFTTKTNSLSNSGSGSGIGAYIAKRMIVESHNGNINFESEYGKGTSFIITLPKTVEK